MIRCALIEMLLPGGGYALVGELRWAAASVGALVLLLLACLVTPWAVLVIAIVRIAAILDAARRGRHGAPAAGWQWKPMLLVGAVSLGMSLMMRLQVLEAFAIPSVSMSPTLQLDDKIMVDKVSIRWRGPERGEVVSFWLGERTFVKRVIGLAGDRVAVRDGVPYVNGVPAVRRPLGMTSYNNRDEQSGKVTRERGFAYEERFAGRTYGVLGADPTEPGSRWAMSDYPRTDLDALGCDGGSEAFRGERGTVGLAAGHDLDCVVPPGTIFVLGDNRNNSADSRTWGAVPVEHVFGRVVGVWMGGPGQRVGRIGTIE